MRRLTHERIRVTFNLEDTMDDSLSNASSRLESTATPSNETSSLITQESGIDFTDLNQLPSRPSQVALWSELSAFIAIDVLGIVGNLLVFSIIAGNARMRTSANLFILSLSVADLLVSILVTPMLIMCRYRRMWPLGHSMCQLQAFVNHTCVFASVFNLTAIAVNRAVVTKLSQRYQVIFSSSLSALYIGITWFFSFLYASFPIMGWGLYGFDSKRLNCIFSRKAAPSFSIFFSLCCLVLPLGISAVAYAIVLNTYIKSGQNLRRFGIHAVSGPERSERKLTKNLFIVWLVFFLCWLPMNLFFLIDPKGDLDNRLYTFSTWLMLCNSCINPFIYGTRRKFRDEYVLMLKKLRCSKRHRSVHPDANNRISTIER